MKRSVMVAGVALVLTLAGATAAFAAGPGGRGAATATGNGRGMMGAGYGRGHMGAGMMGGSLCTNADPTAASANLEAMSASRQAYIDSLEAQLAKATDATVKAQLTYQIELAKLMKGSLDARLTAAKSLPTDQLAAQIALVQADVNYWSQATSTDTTLQQVISNHLANAQTRLTALQAEQAAQAKQ